MIKLKTGRSIAVRQYHLLTPCTEILPEHFTTTEEYDQYVICSLKQIFSRRLFHYQLPQFMTLYEVHKGVYSFHYDHHEKPIQLPRTLDLVGLDLPSNREVLIDLSTAEQKTAITQILHNRTGSLTPLMNYLCTLGFDGWIGGGKIYLCQN